MSALTDIFSEAFVSRLLPFKHEVTLPAMWSFGEPPPAALVVAGAGGLLAALLLYAIGIWLRRMPKKVSTEAQQARIEKMRGAATYWLPWLLIFSPTPVGGMLTIAAGFFAVRPILVVLALIGAEVLWRISPML